MKSTAQLDRLTPHSTLESVQREPVDILHAVDAATPMSHDFHVAGELHTLVMNTGHHANMRFLEFPNNAHNGNPGKQRVFAQAAAGEFFRRCEQASIESIDQIQSTHVVAGIEGVSQKRRLAIARRELARIRDLFDWFMASHVVSANPAASVQGLRLVISPNNMPVLKPTIVRKLLDSIDASMHSGLRDRALIALMFYGCVFGTALGPHHSG